jgi:hypothetical protein
MEDTNSPGCDFVLDKMQVDLNMFRALIRMNEFNHYLQKKHVEYIVVRLAERRDNRRLQ